VESCLNRVVAMFSETTTSVPMEHYTVQERINAEFRYGKRISRCENLRSTIENVVGIPLFKFYFFKKQLILNPNSVFSLDI
jgi:hypothetical protein